MSTQIEKRSSALPSIEKARALLTQCRSVQECQKIKALAQAVASCAAGEEARDEASKIVLLAKARVGELTAEMPKGKARPGSRKEPGSAPKRESLEAEGLSRKEAADCEKIAALKKSGDLDRMFSKSKVAPTTAGAVALQKLPAAQRKTVLSRLGDGEDMRKALGDVRRQARVESLVEIARGNAPLARGETAARYPLIYADPPWRYEHAESESRAIENQYPTMTLDDICGLPLGEITTDDAILFMWATSPKLEEGMRVVREWGFTYRTCMVWDKEKIGMGYYARQQHELLLIATKGSIPVPPPAARPGSVVRIARGEHSAKPHEFYELIERMYPELPKLEMFCRSPRAGWSVWGNQSGAAA